MLKQTSYQLQGYKIVEENIALLQWVKYFGFGVEQGGPCYVVGDILIIGKPANEEIANLIGDFYDQLKSLPRWSKTKYFCKEADISAVSSLSSGANSKRMEALQKYSRPDHFVSPKIPLRPGCYRLGVYRITVNDDLTISWIRYIENGRIAEGKGEISGDILLLTQKVIEKEKGRKQFQMELKSLPPWPFTESFIPYGAASLCIDREYPINSSAAQPIPNRKRIHDAKTVKPESAPRSRRAFFQSHIGPMRSDTKNLIVSIFFTFWGFFPEKLKQGLAFIRKIFSGDKSNQKSKVNFKVPKTRIAWKAKIGVAIIAVLVVGAFIVVFFHHEVDAIAHLIHRDGHSRAHHPGHRSSH